MVTKIERSIPKKKELEQWLDEKQLGSFTTIFAMQFWEAVTRRRRNKAEQQQQQKQPFQPTKEKHFLENCNCFVVAGPGFGKENVLQKLNRRAQKMYSGKTFESWLKCRSDVNLVKNIKPSSFYVGALLKR